METLPAELNNLFLTTEAHDQENGNGLNLRFEEHLEEVCEEKESYPHTYRSGENSTHKPVP